jgi:two-component system LytT family response regulator
MSVLRVLTVDDEPLARERIATLVRETQGLELVGEGSNGLEALDLISQLDPHLLFIDIEMPELSGFGVIAALDRSSVPGVVFVTAFTHYAMQAFDVGAIDYLHKPVTRARFLAAVERAGERLAHASAEQRRALVQEAAQAERARGLRTRFVVRRGDTHQFVPVTAVDWIDVADNYLRLHVGARTHLCRGTMKEAVEELDPACFVRIHRSVIVAVDRVVAVRSRGASYALELRGGTRLRSSRPYAKQVRALLR